MNHLSKRVSDFYVAEIFKRAYERTVNAQKTIKSFKCTGIMPYNLDIFTDPDYVATEVSNVDVKAPESTATNEPSNSTQAQASLTSVSVETAEMRESTSHAATDSISATPTSKLTFKKVSVTDISPQLKTAFPTITRKRQRKKTEIFTSSPIKKALVEQFKKLKRTIQKSFLKQEILNGCEMKCLMCGELYFDPPAGN